MKKKIWQSIVALGSVVMMAGLTGCGDNGATAKLPESEKTPEASRSQAEKKAEIKQPLSSVSQSRYVTTSLITGRDPELEKEGKRLGAVQIELRHGWKTYWRSPGDTGVPPRFDWSQSENVEKVEVKWPAPRRFADVVGQSIGYKKDAVLPLVITPKDPSRPATLKLDMFFGVCSDICVPVQAKMGVVVPVKSTVSRLALEQAMRGVPVSGPGKGFAIHSLKIVSLPGGKQVMRIAAHFPRGSRHEDVFVERLDGEYLPITQHLDRKNSAGAYLFDIPLDEDVNAQSLKGKRLKLTLVSDRGASEVIMSLGQL